MNDEIMAIGMVVAVLLVAMGVVLGNLYSHFAGLFILLALLIIDRISSKK